MSELVDAKRHSGHCTEGTIHIRMQRDASIDDPLGVDTEGGLSCWRRAQSSSFARAARPKSSPGDEIRGRRLKHVSASTVTRHRSQGGMIAPEKMIAEIRMGKKLAELHVRLAVLEAAQQARPRSPGKTGRSRSRDQIARTQSQPKPMLAEAPDIGTPPEIMQGIGQLARQSTKQALGLASASGASMWQLGETMMDMAKEGTHLNIQEDYIYRYGGAPAHVLLFFGGHYRFRSSAVQGVYLFVWLLSFLSCGAVCLINLYFQAIPFHNVPTDLLTGYIHFPVMQGWLFWRRRQDDTLEVVRERIAAKELARFEWEVKAGSWLLLIGSVVFTTIVLGAYAMPTAPQLVGEAGTFKDAQQAVYVAVHGVVMWAMIVPVVFSLMCTFAWFIFYCELHMIDVRETEEKMLTSARELMSHVGTAPESYGQESHRARRRSARFLVKVKALADAVQARLDLTCSAWSFLSLHLLLFATCQIMVVCFNIEAHLIGIPADVGFVYSWWHYLQDVFHGVCGIIVLAIHFGCFARVTAAEDHIVDRVMAELETDADHTHATPELLGSFFALLSHSLSGVKIVSLPFNAETRVAFFWGLLCTFWASFTVIWCDLAFWKDPKKLALTACACLNAWPENATPRIVSGGVVTAAGHVYPFNYGLVSCRVHDYGLPPDCNGTLASVPDWCAQTWCYVNEECDAEDKTASRTLISGQSLFFSSQPCGQAVGATQSRTRSN